MSDVLKSFGAVIVMMLATEGFCKTVIPAFQKWQFERIPLVVEGAETAKMHFPRSNPDNLHCVVCSRVFPAQPGQVQTDRTYCYETSLNRANL